MTKNTIKTETLAEKITTAIGSVGSLVVHTIIFVSCFVAILFGVKAESVMLVLTTIVSLEAIYLSILIQMSVNRSAQKLEHISEDVEEMSEDIEEIQKDVDEIQEDVEEISEDVEEIQKDVEDISEDVEEIQKEVDEIGDDVEELSNEDDDEDIESDYDDERLSNIESALATLLSEVQKLKKTQDKQ